MSALALAVADREATIAYRTGRIRQAEGMLDSLRGKIREALRLVGARRGKALLDVRRSLDAYDWPTRDRDDADPGFRAAADSLSRDIADATIGSRFALESLIRSVR